MENSPMPKSASLLTATRHPLAGMNGKSSHLHAQFGARVEAELLQLRDPQPRPRGPAPIPAQWDPGCASRAGGRIERTHLQSTGRRRCISMPYPTRRSPQRRRPDQWDCCTADGWRRPFPASPSTPCIHAAASTAAGRRAELWPSVMSCICFGTASLSLLDQYSPSSRK